MSNFDRDSIAAADQIIEQLERLHSSPTVARRVLELIGNDEFEIREIVECLEKDPALAATMMRLVNSSYFGLNRKVSSLHQAVAFIGRRSLRLAVLSFGLFGKLTQGTAVEVYAGFWKRALTMAAVGARLCSRRSEIPRDVAYSAGLLADFGVLILAQAETDSYCDLYRQHPHGGELAVAERETYGVDHAALGGRILELWSFPAPLIDAVARHHDAQRSAEPLTASIQTAEILAEVLWSPGSKRLGQAREQLQHDYSLDLDGFITLAVECKASIMEGEAMFGVQLAGSIDCDELLAEARRQYTREALVSSLELDSLTAVFEDHSA